MSNRLRLSLENFQSISEGTLEFKDGLNFIIGQSNSGKSATFRALKTCLLNIIGSQRFIKKGTNNATVTLEYNGNSIIWRRTPKDSSYIINNQEYLKTGKSNAISILSEGNTGFVVDNENSYIMNIEEELQLPFPFGISKAELFKLFENVFCVSDSAIILKSAKDHEDKVKADCKLLELDIKKSETKLEAIKDFKEEVNINTLKDYLNLVKTKTSRLNLLKDGLDTIKIIIKLSSLELVALNVSFEDKLEQYKELVSAKKIIIRLKNLHKLIKETPNYNKSNLLVKYLEYKELRDIYNKITQLEQVSIPEYFFKDRLSKYIELKNYLSELKQIKKAINGLQEKLNYKKGYLEGIQEKLKEFKVCPLCHSRLE